MRTGLLENPIVTQALEIWGNGGWAMIALAVNAFMLFAIGISMILRLRSKEFKRVRENRWRSWIVSADVRKGPVGKLLDFALGADTLADLGTRFSELHTTELAPFNRDLKFMKRAVSTAPLLGLLGTVTGMLTTFSALASGSGGDETMSMVAGGISEALITTETGLVIALPGLFFQYYLSRQRDRYDAFLTKLETACAQQYCSWMHMQPGGAAGNGRAV